MPNELTPFDAMPVMSIDQAASRYNRMVEYVKAGLHVGHDYGIIPGTPKPSLWQPGAEKLCTFFGLTIEDPEFIKQIEDFTGADHGGEPLFYYQVRQRLTRGGQLVASRIACCHSWEKKYRYRDQQQKCPKCGKPNIRHSKDQGSGWYCWRKTGGCGATFTEQDQAIVSQPTGLIPNPDVFELVNTLQQMAQKRAFVSATKAAINASEFFTQDLEEMALADGEIPKSETPKNGQQAQPTQEWSADEAAKVQESRQKIDAFRKLMIQDIADGDRVIMHVDQMRQTCKQGQILKEHWPICQELAQEAQQALANAQLIRDWIAKGQKPEAIADFENNELDNLKPEWCRPYIKSLTERMEST